MEKIEVTNSDEQTRKRKTKLNYKHLSLLSLLVGVVLGAIFIASGIGKLIGYQNEMGTKTVDELSAEIKTLSEEYKAKKQERDKEFEKNGFSEKYLSLNEEALQIDKEISKATNSRYMKTEGFHNPKNLEEMIAEAPEILVGVVVILIGIIIFFVLRRLDMLQ